MSKLDKENNICKLKVFEQIYKDYAQMLRNFLYYKFGNIESAEDITQNSFIKLWENCKKIEINKAKSYLFKTAINLSLNEIKHQKVVLNYSSNLVKGTQNETPEYKMIEQEFQNTINEAIASLTEKQREVFLLNRIEKIKYSDIADLLNISVKAVEKRMHAALIVMRKKVGKV
jgi:RNA polymerase sigma-70 factor (ECF subfamily)